jgi:hypothetical protein
VPGPTKRTLCRKEAKHNYATSTHPENYKTMVLYFRAELQDQCFVIMGVGACSRRGAGLLVSVLWPLLCWPNCASNQSWSEMCPVRALLWP